MPLKVAHLQPSNVSGIKGAGLETIWWQVKVQSKVKFYSLRNTSKYTSCFEECYIRKYKPH